jgi:mycothiol synthase
MTSEIDAIDEVEIPGRPDVPGLRFRHYRGATDHAGMAAANNANRVISGSLEVVTEESIGRQYANLVNSDPHDDLVMVELDGSIIGYARVEWRDGTDGSRYLETVCVLDPTHRRRGIGGAMLAWQERRLLEIAAGLPDDRPSVLRAWTWDRDVGAGALLERRGWTREGRGYEMVRPNLDDIPEIPLPDGFEVRPVRPEDARPIWDASAEAFRDERGEGEWGEGDWASHAADPYRDPSLWAIAWSGDDIAGGVAGRIDPEENAALGVRQGYIAGVWTRRPYRRRGLARALLARVLVLLRDAGMTSAYLGVDGLNPNQALSLYESLGFVVNSSDTDWSKPLATVRGDGRPVEGAPGSA